MAAVDRVASLLRSALGVVECWIGVSDHGDRRVVRLAGHFGEAQVPEFLRACEGAVGLTIDLTDLLSADAAGVDALHRMWLRGGQTLGACGYIQLKLDLRKSGSPNTNANE
jgi:hypothetical protein